MAKKKRKSALPRVTVLALNRRELATFAEAVERLGLYVDELRLLLDRTKAKKKPQLPAIPSALPEVPA